jgi:hypothetical protein
MTKLAVPSDDRLSALLARFEDRAAGWWNVEGDQLEQVAFSAAPDLPTEVASPFGEATRRVPLSRTDLGIAQAVVTGRVTVSGVNELSPETGSGLWLRRFAAVRSVAVPVTVPSGAVALVVSLALVGAPPDDAALAEAIRAVAATWRCDEG